MYIEPSKYGILFNEKKISDKLGYSKSTQAFTLRKEVFVYAVIAFNKLFAQAINLFHHCQTFQLYVLIVYKLLFIA